MAIAKSITKKATSVRMRARPVLAKLMVPQLRDPLPRERLFAQLDRGLHGVWIVGPPGSGKTTLVAHYVHSRKLKPLWFDMNVDDRDPSTFFNMLAEAVRLLTKQPMPSMEIESRADWPAFARRFSRSLFAALPENQVIVFDNVQAPAGALDEILAEFKKNNDERHRLFFLSHEPLPGFLLDAVSKQQISNINADDLRFDLAETAAMIGKFGHDAREATPVYEQTSGWAAGIVLAGLSPGAMTNAISNETRGQIDEYLNRHVFGRLDIRAQKILRCCAYFQSFNAALASAASGDENAGDVLSMLYRKGVFIEQRNSARSGEASYEFHSLFGHALRSAIARDERPLAMQTAAGLLQQTGEPHAAIPLLLEAKSYDMAQRLIVEYAKTILATGRAEQLARWIGELPAEIIRSEPWLDYWRGMALALIDEFASRAAFESAYESFKINNDNTGMLLSAVAVLWAIEVGWDSYAGSLQWAAAFNYALPDGFQFDQPELELYSLSGALSAFGVGSYKRDDLADRVRRFPELLKHTSDRNIVLRIAGQLLNYHQLMREFEQGMLLINHIDKIIPVAEASPAYRAMWLWLCSMFQMRSSGALKQPPLLEQAARCQREVAAIVERHDLTNIRIILSFGVIDLKVQQKNILAAWEISENIKPYLRMNRDRNLSWFHGRRAHLLLLQQKAHEALEEAQTSLAHSRRAHSPETAIAGCMAVEANCLIWLERYDEARAAYAAVIDIAPAGHKRIYLLAIKFILALQALKQNPAVSSAALTGFFTTMRDEKLPDFGLLLGTLLAQLCLIALQREIEVDFVRELVAHRKFLPPDGAGEEWPWPLKIAALGGFSVLKVDQPLEFEGKSQKKPLEMLQLIVAMSDPLDAHKGPKIQQVMDELWPGLEAKDPKGSFDTTLFRLRKLIGVEDAIQLNDGRLMLNRKLVWCDVFALVQRVQNYRRESPEVESGVRITDLYKGPLFGAGNTFTWSISARERLSALFSEVVSTLGGQFEAQGNYREAIRIYEQALQQDNLIEPFYRGQMRCYLALGESAEASRTYRRCKEILSIVLGLKPSAETESLRLTIESRQGVTPAPDA